jgi:hypothetical protein
MAHYVDYILDIPGEQFSARISSPTVNDGGCWEGAVPGCDDELIGQLDGRMTCVTLTSVKYSWLIANDPTAISSVSKMDAALKTCFPNVRILRLDELLYGDWEQLQQPQHKHDPKTFEKLVEWISVKDPAHWKLIH